MRTPIVVGALAAALAVTATGVAQAHIAPSALDTNTASPGIQLPANTNLVLCSNHAASTLHAVNISNQASATPYRVEKFTGGQCKALQLEPGYYRIGGFGARATTPPPCVNGSTDPNYADCPRPHEWIKVVYPGQEESTWLEESVIVNVQAAPAAPTYGYQNGSNLNYPTTGSNNVAVVSVSFASNPQPI
ncbi:MAG: hypothetical protein ACT4QF_19640 [Sporichthyaceae bacterium]